MESSSQLPARAGEVETTTVVDAIDDDFETITRIVSSVNLGILMLGLGCAIELEAMLGYLKRPKQFATGLALQLLLMPFLGLGLSQMVQMPSLEALGVIIQSSCPGGTYSNVMTYWLQGDMNLSIVMTTTSTILAMGTLPLWLYVLPIIIGATGAITIPFDQLGYALLGSVGPLFLGFLFKYKFPQHASKVTKFCTILASVAIVVTAIVIGATQKRTIVVTWRQGVVAVLFPAFALLIGYAATRLPFLTFTVSARRTVAIETAMQNSAIGTTIVLISFSSTSPDFIEVFMFPVLYGGVQLFGGLAAVTVYLVARRRGHTCLVPSDAERSPSVEPIADPADTIATTPVSSIETLAGVAIGNGAAMKGGGIANPNFSSDENANNNYNSDSSYV